MKTDLEDFGIPVNLEEIKRKSKESFKKEVKLKAKEFSLEMLLKKKEGHSKMDNLTYGELGIQTYFSMDNISTETKLNLLEPSESS